jgi:DNA-binding transcriptional MerR regulator|tara:strand:+ start:142 stop:492 length:351 start_codon:yes stop_codon:yes gene_type:complete
MTPLEDRRYSISETSEILDLPAHVLRQWEKQITLVKPKRDSANRRYYKPEDIQKIKRVKQFVRSEKMTLEGAAIRLSQELKGQGTPQTNDEALELIDKIEQKARRVIEILDQYDDK